MSGRTDKGFWVSVVGVLVLSGGLFYLWTLNSQLSERVDLLSADLDTLRKERADLGTRQLAAPAAGSGQKERNRPTQARSGVAAGDGDVIGPGQIVQAEGMVAKTPFEIAKAEKKSRSERYSDRIRKDLEDYAEKHDVPRVSVDEAMLIIEAWAEDRRFYKDSVQSGDLSKDQARNETRAGLGEVQEQLRIIFGDYHYAALDETISFLSRLPGAREGVGKEP
jgi:hypothetical protein